MGGGEFISGPIRRGNSVTLRGTRYVNKHRKCEGDSLGTFRDIDS